MVEHNTAITKAEYEKKLPVLRTQLFAVQQKIISAKIPVLIVVCGVPGAGRGEVINLLNEWMDARSIKNRTFWRSSDEVRERPEYWRYWSVLPAKGEMGIFFGGWYARTAEKAVSGKIKSVKFDWAMNEAIHFEQMLAADGMLIVKLWLHLSKEDYKKRSKKLGGQTDPLAGKSKHSSKENYDELMKCWSKTIRMTDTTSAHWYVINCHNTYQRNLSVLELLASTMQNALSASHRNQDCALAAPVSNTLPAHVLDRVDLSKKIEDKEYAVALKKYQTELRELTLKAYWKGISTIILFEGWDAAGKGGNIRRVTVAIDARIRQTIQVGPPTDEEKAHHYLWRFWRHIPRAGHVTLYDRSWYGRVLVERVENFASVEEWSRAYEEINHFETQLVNHGCVLIKFWLHISQDEQLRRFKEREELEWKNYKITPEDWRNREKADLYMDAVDDMLIRTSTDIAPWSIVPSDDKHYARVTVLRMICEQLRKKLK